MANRTDPMINTTVTNVPGPQVALYSGGAKLVSMLGLGNRAMQIPSVLYLQQDGASVTLSADADLEWITGYAAAISLVSVLLLGILQGVLLAALASIFLLLGRAARPNVAFLGRLPGTGRYSDSARHEDRGCCAMDRSIPRSGPHRASGGPSAPRTADWPAGCPPPGRTKLPACR